MKHLAKVFLCIASLGLLLTGCDQNSSSSSSQPSDPTPVEPSEQTVKVTGVSLNKEQVTLKVGEEDTLIATVSPDNATNKEVIWSSSDSAIVKVNNGVLTAKKVGETDVYVATKDGNHTAKAHVKVEEGEPTVNPSLNFTEKSITVGDEFILTINDIPEGETPIWSQTGTAVSFVLENSIKADSAKVKGLEAGESTISATVGDVTLTCEITVTESTSPVDDPVSVTSVTLNKTSFSLKVGGSETLTATVLPQNATNKNVTWSSSNTSIATVSNGVVTAKAAGEADITVTTVDGNKTATAKVTVTEGTTPVTPSEETITYTFNSKSWGASPKNWSSLGDGYAYDSNKKGVQVTTGASGASAKSPESYDAVKKVVVSYCTNSSKGAGSISVYVGDTLVKKQSVTSSGGTTYRELTFSVSELTGYVSFEVECTTNSIYVNKITIEHGESVPTDPTAISIGKDFNIVNGKTKQLSVTYTPSNANQNKDVTWSSSDEDVATVSATGLVTASKTAAIGSTATITATLKFDTTIKASCVLTIAEEVLDSYTLLFYVCGADLESDSSQGGWATEDIKEILSVSGQPDDVNIVLETGGAKKWKSTYPIKNTELGRWHVENKSLVKDGAVDKVSMGESSTLQSFLEWGIENYPAEKYGLFMWNHGGAMDGCCFDENFDNDSLTNSEVYNAVKNARATCGLTEKLEFIAYDACLMAVQDIAEYNSLNFNYMISSQESEYAGGYDYDEWLPTLYNNPNVNTVTLLTEVADTFIAEQNAAGCYDQTQAVYDLSKMAAYKEAWEDMTEGFVGIIDSASKWTTFATAVNKAQKYGYYDDEDAAGYNGGYLYDIFDVVGALTELKKVSAYSSISGKIQAVLDAHDQVVVHEIHGNKMSGSHGMCLFCPLSGYNICEDGEYVANYSKNNTNFTKWHSFVAKYGSWYSE